MTLQAYTKQRSLTPKKPRSTPKPERLETVSLQEQFGSRVPLRNERPAAEVLSECLVDSDPASTTLIFIP